MKKIINYILIYIIGWTTIGLLIYITQPIIDLLFTDNIVNTIVQVAFGALLGLAYILFLDAYKRKEFVYTDTHVMIDTYIWYPVYFGSYIECMKIKEDAKRYHCHTLIIVEREEAEEYEY